MQIRNSTYFYQNASHDPFLYRSFNLSNDETNWMMTIKNIFYFWFFHAVSYMILQNVLLYNMLANVGESVVIHFGEWLDPNHSVVLHALPSD